MEAVLVDVTGWIKFLGEITWRVADWPQLDSDADRNYWFRLYGVGSLFGTVVLLFLWLLNSESAILALDRFLSLELPTTQQAVVNAVLIGLFALMFIPTCLFSCTVIGGCLGVFVIVVQMICLFLRPAWTRWSKRLRTTQQTLRQDCTMHRAKCVCVFSREEMP